MANASKKHMGPAEKGKGSGTGALTSESVVDGLVGENMVLSNRDKAQHSQERGLDSGAVQADQLQDGPANRAVPDGEATSNTTGTSAPMSTTSGEDSSLKSRRGQSGGLAEEPDDDR